LTGLGFQDDPETAQTPERMAQFLREFSPGEPPVLSTFPVNSSGAVVLRDLPFYALCAHHLLPFFGTATIGYVPSDRVGGFSGIARLLQYRSRGPQLQERMAEQLADDMVSSMGATGVVVKLSARQLCMEMRGACTPGTIDVFAERGDTSPIYKVINPGA
jgi:GTP cyclohydrolase I